MSISIRGVVLGNSDQARGSARTSHLRRGLSIFLFFAVAFGLTAASEGAQLTLKIGDREEVVSQFAPNQLDVEKYIHAPCVPTTAAPCAPTPEPRAVVYEARAYRDLSVSWEKDTKVIARLFGEMGRTKKVRKVHACGNIVTGETGWKLGPDDLVCNGQFVDGASLIEFEVNEGEGKASFLYIRILNRKFPFAGSDAGVVLTLTEPLEKPEGSAGGFESNSGLSIYYAVSRLKSDQWRAVVNVAALDQMPDEKDLEVGIGLGFLFKSNGFLDSNSGLSLSAGLGYNLMIPKESERWYWFVGLGTNFDLQGED